jgi:HEAT repeat protein
MGRTAAAAAAVLLAIGAAAGEARAHGGQYRGPGGKTPDDPTAPTVPPGSTADWEAWWTSNAWRYVNLRERLRLRDRGGDAVSGGGLGSHGDAAPGEGAAHALDPRLFYGESVLPVILAALEDPDAEVRSAAAVALGKMAYPRSLFALRKAVADPVRDVRDGAVLALGMLGEPFAAEDLRRILLDPRQPDRTRSFAAVGLGLLGGEDGAGSLLAYLDPAADATRHGGIDRSALIEASAVTGLGMSRWSGAAGPILKAFRSDARWEPVVRSFAAVALARLGEREAIPYLLLALEHDREPLRQSAALALGVLAKEGDAGVVPALIRHLHEEKDANTRQFSLMSLAKIGGDPARAAVRKYLERPSSRMDLPLAALAAALGKDPEALASVRRLYAEEKQPSLKSAYALALGLYGDRESAAEMRRLAAADNLDRTLRGNLFLALGLMEDSAAGDAARKALKEENDPGVRMAAAVCLGLLKDRAVVNTLETMVKEDPNAYMRSAACRILGHVGSPVSARVLVAVVQDPKDNSVVRMAATAALGNLADRNLIPVLSTLAFDSNYATAIDPLVEIATIL